MSRVLAIEEEKDEYIYQKLKKERNYEGLSSKMFLKANSNNIKYHFNN